MRRLLLSLLLSLPVPALAKCLIISEQGTPEVRKVIDGGVYPCIYVTAEARFVTLINVEVTGGIMDPPYFGQGILVRGDDITIRDAKVHHVPGHGIIALCVPSGGDCQHGPRRLRIEDSTVEYAGGNGIKFDTCEGCVIQRTHVDHSSNSGVQINQADAPFEISDCEIEDSGWNVTDGRAPHGIYTGEPGRIEHNRIHGNRGYGIHIWPGPGPRTVTGNPLVIKYNRIYRNQSGGTVIGADIAGHVFYIHNAEYWNGDSELLP